MKIYTKTGDKGQTGLFGGARVQKNDKRVEAYGTVDELNSVLGVARAANMPDDVQNHLRRIQSELFVLGAEIACTPGKLDRLKMDLVGEKEVLGLEALIDDSELLLPPLKYFILPDGSPAGAALHMARTVARRAERCCLDIEVRSEVLIYLNRLSDCLFVLARRVNLAQKCPESPWAGQAH